MKASDKEGVFWLSRFRASLQTNNLMTELRTPAFTVQGPMKRELKNSMSASARLRKYEWVRVSREEGVTAWPEPLDDHLAGSTERVDYTSLIVLSDAKQLDDRNQEAWVHLGMSTGKVDCSMSLYQNSVVAKQQKEMKRSQTDGPVCSGSRHTARRVDLTAFPLCKVHRKGRAQFVNKPFCRQTIWWSNSELFGLPCSA